MSLTKPATVSELDKFSDVIGEDRPFTLDGIRVVEANARDYGKGEMVVIRARGHEKELGVWGSYLVHQARDVDPGDLGKRYRLVRTVIPGFSDREVKALVPDDE